MNIHIIDTGFTIREALKRINELSGRNMTLFVLDDQGSVKGTLTDGDIRRHLLKGGSLDDLVALAMHTGFMALKQNDDPCQVIEKARKKDIKMLPQVDAEGRLVRLIDLAAVKTILPMDAVLMAGGKGERLRPLTLSTPKPLLKVGEKAIIDYNVDELLANGIDRIHVTVNYLKEQLINHFKDEPRVKCVAEPKRLGTLGSLSLISDWNHDDVLVMNSDLLTSLDFRAMYLSHKESGAALTMATIPYAVSVPFAVLKTDEDRVTGLMEKPVYNYFANAGVYIIKREFLASIPVGEYLDAPDFVEQLIEKGEYVGHFPINGTWIDIGSPDDFRNARQLVGLKGARNL